MNVKQAPANRRLLKTSVRPHDGEIEFSAREAFRIVIGSVVINVELGLISDGFSIPRWLKPLFRRLFLKCPLLLFSAVAHDVLYSKSRVNGVTRAEADKIFLKLLRYYGAKRRIAWLFYIAVRTCGWMFWRKKEDTFVKQETT